MDTNLVWLNLLTKLINLGKTSAPRGIEVKEILGLQAKVNMECPIITIPERKLGYRFMSAEAAWILSGDERVSTIAPYSKDISRFSDDTIVFYGAYGPRVQAQLIHIVSSLSRDPDTRQAVINIWRENPPQSKDIPCSLSLQFLIRRNRLNCIYTMRSSDAWLGFPYDVVNMSMISHWVRMFLKRSRPDLFAGLTIGSLYFTAGSAHLYKKDEAQALAIVNARQRLYPSPKIPAFDEMEAANDLTTFLWNAADHPSKRGLLAALEPYQ